MPKEAVPYSEKNYKQHENLYDSLAQCIQEMKRGMVHSASSWNMPAEHINGITTRFVEGNIEISYHRYEVTTVEGLARLEVNEEGKKYIKEVVKELKKRFKRKTGKPLTMKEVSSDNGLEKVSRLTAETSWMLGSSRYGHGARPVGRYLVKDCMVFEYSANV